MDAVAYFNLYEKNLQRMQAAVQGAAPSILNDRSPLWENVLERRPSFASFSDLLTIFSGHSKIFGSATGGRAIQEDRFEQFSAMVSRFRHLISPQQLDQLQQSTFGAPWIFRLDDYIADEWFFYNAAMAVTILRSIEALGARITALRVLEIGSGYGAVASQLVRTGAASAYHFVDLHENLFVALMYMGYHHPEFRSHIAGEPSVTGNGKTLYFYLPNHFAFAEGPYDLVINTSSLGEMSKQTAEGYVRALPGKLAEDGLFISHNGLGSYASIFYSWRNEPGFQPTARLSDYGYLEMEIKHFRPSPTFSGGLEHGGHHLIICGLKGRNSPHLEVRDFDTLGFLITGMLSDEIIDICDRFTKSGLTSADRIFLDAAATMFEADDERKLESLNVAPDDRDLMIALTYLRALVGLSIGRLDVFERAGREYIMSGRSLGAVGWISLSLHVCEELRYGRSEELEKLRLYHPNMPPHFLKSAHTLHASKPDATARLKMNQYISKGRISHRY